MEPSLVSNVISRWTSSSWPLQRRKEPPDGGATAGVPSSLPRLRRINRTRAPRKTKEEWQQIEPIFKKLYVEDDMALEEVMQCLQAEYGFIATQNQFKSRIMKWKIDKKIKGSEMKHIVTILRRRRQENPTRATEFFVRNRRVDEAKIERFQREHGIPSPPSSATPSVISYRSSSPQPRVSPDESELGTPCLLNPTQWPDPVVGTDRTPSHAFSSSQEPNTGLATDSFLIKWPHSPSRQTSHSEVKRLVRPLWRRLGQAGVHGRTTLTPNLKAFPWWKDYTSFQTRQTSSMPNVLPLYEILKSVIVQGNTFEDEMFNQTKSHEFQILYTEVASLELTPEIARLLSYLRCDHAREDGCNNFVQGGSCSRVETVEGYCVRCNLTKLLRVSLLSKKVWHERRFTLSYRADWRWCLSEASKLILQNNGDFLAPLVTFTEICHQASLGHEARTFSDAGLRASQVWGVGLEAEVQVAIQLSAQLLTRGDYSRGQRLLRTIMRDNLGIPLNLQEEPLKVYLELPSHLHEGNLVLLQREAISLYNTIKWMLLHPMSMQNAFRSGKHAWWTSCYGCSTFDYHFCFSGSCAADFSLNPRCISSDENLTDHELQWTGQDFSIEYDFSRIAFQCFWRFLLKYGYLLEAGAWAASESEESYEQQ